MRTEIIGTTPKVILNANTKRVRWSLQFAPSSVNPTNTGFIFVGRGFIPNATIGDPNQGEVLNSGAYIEEKKQFAEDTLPYKGAIWAVSGTADQQVVIDEQSEGD